MAGEVHFLNNNVEKDTDIGRIADLCVNKPERHNFHAASAF